MSSAFAVRRANSENACSPGSTASQASPALSPNQRERAIATLRVIVREQLRWKKVHAAEFLLDVDRPEGIAEHFRSELQQHADEPQYRIGIWRVLFCCPSNAAGSEQHHGEIIAAASHPQSSDRLHAIEAIAKLNLPLKSDQQAVIQRWTDAADAAEAPFGHWALAVQDGAAYRDDRLSALLKTAASQNVLGRLRAAYALGRLQPLPRKQQEELIRLGLAIAPPPADDPIEQLADAHLLASSWHAAFLNNDAAAVHVLRDALKQHAANSTEVNRIFVDELARSGDVGDFELLMPLLSAADRDLAASAAHALLSIDKRALAIGQ